MKANPLPALRVLLCVALLPCIASAAESPQRTGKKAKLAVASEESPAALAARMAKGDAFFDEDKFAEAEAEYRAVYFIRKRGLGPKHPHTEDSQSKLNQAIYGRLGKHWLQSSGPYVPGEEDEVAEAEKEIRAVLQYCQREFGWDDQLTAEPRLGLAKTLSSQSRYAEEEIELRAVLAIYERVRGPEDSKTLDLRWQRAQLLEYMGKLADAEKEIRALFAIGKRRGIHHYISPEFHILLAETLEELGKGAEAAKEFRRAAAGYVKSVDGKHDWAPEEEYWRSLNALARALAAEGKYAKAEEAYRKYIATVDRFYEKQSVLAVIAQNSVGIMLQNQGKSAEAEREFRANIPAAERFFGLEHRNTLIVRCNLAETLSRQGKYAEAEKEERAVLAIRERILCRWDPGIFDSCRSLAKCLADQGNKEEALPFARRAAEGYEKVWSPSHPTRQAAEKFLRGLENP